MKSFIFLLTWALVTKKTIQEENLWNPPYVGDYLVSPRSDQYAAQDVQYPTYDQYEVQNEDHDYLESLRHLLPSLLFSTAAVSNA